MFWLDTGEQLLFTGNKARALLAREIGVGLTMLPQGKCAVILAANAIDRMKPFINGTAVFVTHWNGSFHDCWYCSVVVGFGRRPSQARRRAKVLLSALAADSEVPFVDRGSLRMAARSLVRPGD